MNARLIPGGLTSRLHAALVLVANSIWKGVRPPLVAVLSLLEPLMCALFSLAIVSGITTAILFETSAAGPRFPFLEMLALSLGFGAALIAYYSLLFLVSR